MSKYTGYNPDWGKKATQKYVREKQHQVNIKWKKTEYAERIEPAIKKAGIPVATFIKQAVDEKIARMSGEDKASEETE